MVFSRQTFKISLLGQLLPILVATETSDTSQRGKTKGNKENVEEILCAIRE